MPELSGESPAITIAVYAALIYDVVSATNSSPQTTEINAPARAPTLMKWVKLGLAQGGLFVAMGVYFDKRRWPPAVGGGIAAALLWMQYVHAKNEGLRNPGPPTEQYAQGGSGQSGTLVPAAEGGAAAALVSSAIGAV